MFPLVETIRFENGKLHNLELHQERIDRSRKELFPTSSKISISDEIIQPDTVNPNGLYKVRILYGERVGYIEWLPYSMKQINKFKLVESDEIDYHLKYSDRSILNLLSDLKEDADTVIIVKNGMITDTAFGNLLFCDDDKWITPSTPLLKGVMREKLLRDGKITERQITQNDLKNYTSLKMINAMIPLEKAPQLPMNSIINL